MKKNLSRIITTGVGGVIASIAMLGERVKAQTGQRCRQTLDTRMRRRRRLEVNRRDLALRRGRRFISRGKCLVRRRAAGVGRKGGCSATLTFKRSGISSFYAPCSSSGNQNYTGISHKGNAEGFSPQRFKSKLQRCTMDLPIRGMIN